MNAHVHNKTSGEYLADAKALIERDEASGQARSAEQRDLHMQAASDIYTAIQLNPKLTQRKVAEYIGKSAAWVNTLLIWQHHGFSTPTAFGPQSKERQEKRSGQPKQETVEGRDRNREIRKEKEETARAKAAAEEAKATARAEQAKARAKAEEEKTQRARDRADQRDKTKREKLRMEQHNVNNGRITKQDRARLIKFLCMLGSNSDGERATAAKHADDLVKKLRFPNGWNDLIVRAAR